MKKLCLSKKHVNDLLLKIQKQLPGLLYKKGVLKKFRKGHRNAPVPESLFNKVAGLRLNNFFTEHLRATALAGLIRRLHVSIC